MVPIAVLESRHGGKTFVGYHPGTFLTVARTRNIDSYIVSTEDGFSPLGANLRYLTSQLGIPQDEIKRLANWNRFKNPRVTLVLLASRRTGTGLKGVVLAPSETSDCYKRYAVPRYGRPYRDFYYNVTYEAIAYAAKHWGASDIAISHLSAYGTFHEDIATCNAEALAHFCDTTHPAIKSFIFLGDLGCISADHLAGIGRLNTEARSGTHREIATETDHRDGHILVHLDWKNGSAAVASLGQAGDAPPRGNATSRPE